VVFFSQHPRAPPVMIHLTLENGGRDPREAQAFLAVQQGAKLRSLLLGPHGIRPYPNVDEGPQGGGPPLTGRRSVL